MGVLKGTFAVVIWCNSINEGGFFVTCDKYLQTISDCKAKE